MRYGSHRLASWRVLLVVSLVLTVAAGAAYAIRSPSDDRPSDQDRLSYVALGDSYTSAPYVPPREPDDPCLRSESNYPHLLAERIPALDLADVSCGGATTVNMTEPQTLKDQQRPAQFDALEEDTDLVTVGIGANDSDLFVSLIYACFPGVQTGGICHAASPRGEALQAIVDRVQGNVQQVLEDIAARSPDARIVVVPYPQLTSPDARCPGRFSFGAADSAYIADVMQRVSTALADAATAAGAEYVDVLAASQGHEICSDEPWVMGERTDVNRAASFHPLSEGQRAVAELLHDQLCADDFIC